jgi:hypothetical protein
VVLAFVAVDSQRRVIRDVCIDVGGNRVQPRLELRQIGLAVNRQAKRRVVLLTLGEPGVARNEVVLKVGPTARVGDGDVPGFRCSFKVVSRASS